MHVIFSPPGPKIDPCFEPIQAENTALPAGDLGDYLRRITPTGAPAVNLVLPGLRRGADLYPLPVTNADWPNGLRGELENVTVLTRLRGRPDRERVPLKRPEIEQLVELLAPGPLRPDDGLPFYRPDVWSFDRRLTKTGRRSAVVRQLAAAVAYDLGGHDLIEVSAKVLGLHDHGFPSFDPKWAREYLRLGRQLWALLGVWPWTHAPLGKLPKDWQTDATFLGPLHAWHERACREREQEAAGCRWALSIGRDLVRSDVGKLPLEGVPPVEPKQLDQTAKLDQLKQLGWSRETAEEDARALLAMVDAHAERREARERAREDRRAVQ